MVLRATIGVENVSIMANKNTNCSMALAICLAGATDAVRSTHALRIAPNRAGSPPRASARGALGSRRPARAAALSADDDARGERALDGTPAPRGIKYETGAHSPGGRQGVGIQR